MDKLRGDLPEDVRKFIREWEDESVDYITVHTSGSTGKPKELHLPKSLVTRSALRSNRHFDITSDSRLHLALSPQYIAGKMLIVRALLANARFTCEPPSQNPLYEPLDVMPIRLISLVGAQLPGFVDAMNKNPNLTVRNLLLGGAPLNSHLRRLACSGTWTPWESYGMTETASHIALRKIHPDKNLPFQTLPGISVRKSCDNSLIIDMGDDGVLLTNDIAEILDESHFYILGRKDNVIITGGHKVFPEKIEQVLSSVLPPERAFIVSSRPSFQWGEEITLVIEGAPFPMPDFKDLPLKNFEIPRAILFVPELPRTSSSKIIRKF